MQLLLTVWVIWQGFVTFKEIASGSERHLTAVALPPLPARLGYLFFLNLQTTIYPVQWRQLLSIRRSELSCPCTLTRGSVAIRQQPDTRPWQHRSKGGWGGRRWQCGVPSVSCKGGVQTKVKAGILSPPCFVMVMIGEDRGDHDCVFTALSNTQLIHDLHSKNWNLICFFIPTNVEDMLRVPFMVSS